MSPEQSRAARGWLGWSQQDLAKKASVGLSTVKDFESGNRTPIANNLSAIQKALESGGVDLIFDPLGAPIGINKKTLGNSSNGPNS
ncbi:helix-turn-helix transcriptional regulator [Bradyrhizobium sp. dw_411]|uniref:helix-turn-helix domain-containing protein n=1 Tax=Bradyrhizobium sp. dw_411 TaxID=2720082 RepID=UPI001BCBF761|nr:helix-turn-helix transcriptional regulator [Bradyrhizobium sp. dw_411]